MARQARAPGLLTAIPRPRLPKAIARRIPPARASVRPPVVDTTPYPPQNPNQILDRRRSVQYTNGMRNTPADVRCPPPLLLTFGTPPNQVDSAREYVPRVHDLTPIRQIPRRRVGPDLPRTRGRHPKLRGATLAQLKAIASYRKRNGKPTIYAGRAARGILRALNQAERNLRIELQADRARMQRSFDLASQLQVMLRASRSRTTPTAFPGTLVRSNSRSPIATRSHIPCSTAPPPPPARSSPRPL